MNEYDHKKIEKKWQAEWNVNKIYETLDPQKAKKKGLKKCYVLDMFPYPSGAGLHVGHPRGYIGSDVYARMKRMSGYNVLHPMGYDAFGLPAEQYAIEHNVHPRKAVEANIKTFRSQLDKIGFSYDWSRTVNTTDPEYYKWTQWIFLQIYNSYYDKQKNKARPISELIKRFETKGGEKFNAQDWKSFSKIEKQKILMNYRLAYEGFADVNWCPKLGTVLANDEVVPDAKGNPVSERGGYPVEKKSMRQWFMRITAYADRLLTDLDGLNWPESIKEIQKNWIGKNGNSYNMRDAIFARQRYWGEPIPLRHDKNGLIIALKEKDLPLTLPNVKSYEPAGTGESPLAGVKSWVNDGYETNTMPGWAGSSWYFLRYIDPNNKKEFAGKASLDYYFDKKNGGVDMYVGGQEHATGHLLYSRFWHKFLYDLGYVQTPEPFKTLKNQGMILASDGRKMSKRWGNVINPDEIVAIYGADTLRLYEMFMGPFEASQPWNTDSIIGSRRFLDRTYRLSQKINVTPENVSKSSTQASMQILLHKTIQKVSDDIENMNFNTAVSSMMILLNEFEKVVASGQKIKNDDFKLFLQILAPFAPHMTDELWHQMGEKNSIHISKWPKAKKIKEIETLQTIVIQINGKLRGEVQVNANATEEQIKKLAVENNKVSEHLKEVEILRTIYVSGKLINFVTKVI